MTQMGHEALQGGQRDGEGLRLAARILHGDGGHVGPGIHTARLQARRPSDLLATPASWAAKPLCRTPGVTLKGAMCRMQMVLPTPPPLGLPACLETGATMATAEKWPDGQGLGQDSRNFCSATHCLHSARPRGSFGCQPLTS